MHVNQVHYASPISTPAMTPRRLSNIRQSNYAEEGIPLIVKPPSKVECHGRIAQHPVDNRVKISQHPVDVVAALHNTPSKVESARTSRKGHIWICGGSDGPCSHKSQTRYGCAWALRSSSMFVAYI